MATNPNGEFETPVIKSLEQIHDRGYQASAPRIIEAPASLKSAVFQTLWLDPRGTGLSTPLSPEVLTSLPSGTEKADYLKHFRADSIGERVDPLRMCP